MPEQVTLTYTVELSHSPDEGTPSPDIVDIYSALRMALPADIDILITKEN